LPMSSSTSSSTLPSGLAVLWTFPDALFIPEIVSGGLVWILVASSKVPDPMLQGWVMFVSVFCCIMSFCLLGLYFCGAHGGGSGHWVTLVRACANPRGLPCPAAPCRAGCCCCTASCSLHGGELTGCCVFPSQICAFVATLLYVIHHLFSLLRWKSS
ncbi:MAL protein, partial [Hylia prasina]|nr:MAL protein [Hylia prasina]